MPSIVSGEKTIDISVVIITWNSALVIKQCVDSVINNSLSHTVELIIIDNSSSDNTFSIINNIKFSNLQIYRNPDNFGFTKGVNKGLALSSGRNIMLLNPDAVLSTGCLDKLCKFLDENPSYGACAPLMLNEDGSVQRSVRTFPTFMNMFFEFTLLAYIFPKSGLFGNWKMKYYHYEKDDDVNQPMAAAFMFRSGEPDKLDERFKMFFSDVDLCRIIINSGKKIRLITSVNAVHKHGESVYKDRIRMIKVWNSDCIEYFWKYYPNPVLILWLRINLKISEFLRILWYKIKN